MNRIFLADYVQRWVLIKTDDTEKMLIFPYKRLANGKISVYGFMDYGKSNRFFHTTNTDQTIEYDGTPANITHPKISYIGLAMERELRLNSLFKGVIIHQPWSDKDVEINSDKFSMSKDNEVQLGGVSVFKEGEFAKYIKHQPNKISIERAIEDLYFNLLGQEIKIEQK